MKELEDKVFVEVCMRMKLLLRNNQQVSCHQTTGGSSRHTSLPEADSCMTLKPSYRYVTDSSVFQFLNLNISHGATPMLCYLQTVM